MNIPHTQEAPLTLKLDGTPHAYEILIKAGGLALLGQDLQKAGISPTQKIMVVYDVGLPSSYLQQVRHALESSDFKMLEAPVPQGEVAKDLKILEGLYAHAMQAGMTRKDVFLALGGGVVGDLTGFLASSYYRGTRFVQVPTTLLSQVDSSVGGKVAVNFGDVKNSIGAFKQPDLVSIDTKTLQTLPPREIQAGLAELFKYALIEATALDAHIDEDTSLLADFERLKSDWRLEENAFIRKACAIKAAVVMRDETESFPANDARGRVCLNMGHTFAHAYEACYGYGRLLHGEAVAIGMLCAIFTNDAVLGDAHVKRIIDLMEDLALFPYDALKNLAGLPTPEDLIPFMAKDKKVLQAGQLRVVLPVLPLGTVTVGSLPAHDAVMGIEKAHAYLKTHGLESATA
jgi:3-dehydroquinate synthase